MEGSRSFYRTPILVEVRANLSERPIIKIKKKKEYFLFMQKGEHPWFRALHQITSQNNCQFVRLCFVVTHNSQPDTEIESAIVNCRR